MSPRFTASRSLRAVACLVAGLSLACLTGCNILGPVGYLAHGPPRTKKVYELPKERSAVVLVDDRASQLPRRVLRSQIGQIVESELLERGALVTVKSTDSALTVVSREDYNTPMGIDAVGRAVGADVVIYASVVQFSLTQDGYSYTPTATVRVKVIDSATGERLWPGEDPGYHQIFIASPTTPGDAPTNTGERMRAESQLADRLAREVAWLFVDVDRNEAESRIRGGANAS